LTLLAAPPLSSPLLSSPLLLLFISIRSSVPQGLDCACQREEFTFSPTCPGHAPYTIKHTHTPIHTRTHTFISISTHMNKLSFSHTHTHTHTVFLSSSLHKVVRSFVSFVQFHYCIIQNAIIECSLPLVSLQSP